MVEPRHIQNHSEAQALQPHWGYADRVIPCTNDVGSCQYLDSVYGAHDIGMLYVGIIWATIGGILLIWIIARKVTGSAARSSQTGLEKFLAPSSRPRGRKDRLWSALGSASRRWLLPESLRSIFGRTTRLQVAVLALLVGYLTIWTFSGIAYKRWITPVKNNPGLYNVRSGLGPFSDRVGVLAYALIPLSVLLSSRESILSLITGIPYQHFNFIHRWLGYVILAQSILHTIGWTIIEVRLYQPQPTVARDWIKQLYMIWGVIAMIFLLMMFVLSLKPVIRITGYEFFRKAHYVIAMLFIGACWGHWEQLKCFLLPSLLLWFADRGARLIRAWLTHYQLADGKIGFVSAQAQLTLFPDSTNGDVVRLDFTYPHDPWSIGQHFYLCFPELSIWQSHPFTPMSLPNSGSKPQQHSYLIRAKTGETAKLASLAARKESDNNHNRPLTSAILTGAYGEETLKGLELNHNVLCIAGGSGITYVLPVLLHLAQQPIASDRRIELIWAIRMESDLDWIRQELDLLEKAVKTHGITIKIYVTRECCQRSNKDPSSIVSKKDDLESSSISGSSDGESQETRKNGEILITKSIKSSRDHVVARPDLRAVTTEFLESTIDGPTRVYASGPSSMVSDLRSAVAASNVPSKVWKGDRRFEVDLICDERLDW